VLRWSFLPALALAWPQLSAAGDSDSTRASLKGLTAFDVVVEQIGSKVDGKDAALKREDLQTEVEARLAKAGIRVSKDAAAVLYANVAVVCNRGSCAFDIVLEVQQRVRLARRPRAGTLIAPTWTTGVTGLVARRPDLIRENLRDQVDQFVAAYRSANPAK
jgi:hypothetical protein